MTIALVGLMQEPCRGSLLDGLAFLADRSEVTCRLMAIVLEIHIEGEAGLIGEAAKGPKILLDQSRQ